MIEAVIFDMDGVVVDSEPLYQKAEEQFFATYGITIPPEDWKLFRGSTEGKFYELARNRYKIDESVDALQVKGRQYVFKVFANELVLKSGFAELYDRIQGMYKIGLVTSTPRVIFHYMDEQINLSQYFRDVIVGEDTELHKPHPQPYLTMMAQLNVRPDHCVIVEDSIPGLESAYASGAYTVAITGSVPPEHMPPAHAIIHSLDEITADFLESVTSKKMKLVKVN